MQEFYNKLRPLLSSKHPNLVELQAIRYELAEHRAEAYKDLLEMRIKRLRPKDHEWTDLDRVTEMNAFCAQLEYDKQFLDDLWQIVSDIINSAP